MMMLGLVMASNLVIVEVVNIVFAAGMFLNAISFIPQAWKLYKMKTSKELSLIMFLIFLITQVTASLHGYYSHDYELMYTYLPSIITCGIVTTLIILYRINRGRERTCHIE